MSKYRNSEVTGFADALRALGHPHRLAIFLRLAECCRGSATCTPDMRACVGDVGGDLGVAPSTVSHHLKELRGAGLIHMERAGQKVECWIEPETVKAIARFLRASVA